MSLVKLSIENIDNNTQKLHELDMSKSLVENIEDICELFQKPRNTTAYGLKCLLTTDGKQKNTYITEDNFTEIQNGYSLKLVYSVSYYVQRIFQHISDRFRERSFEDLHDLWAEPEFIKELVKKGKHLVLIDYYTTTDLQDKEAQACLLTILHIFKKNYFTEISGQFLQKIIDIIKCCSISSYEQQKCALSIVTRILYQRGRKFNQWKEKIIKEIPIDDLTPFICNEQNPSLQCCALLLINTLIKCCKGEKRQQLINEISLQKNRDIMYKHIILVGNINNTMAHELYVHQTFLLSLHDPDLKARVWLNDALNFQREDFEIDTNELKRSTILIDFDDSLQKLKHPSLENLIKYDDVRISFASMSSKDSDDLVYTNKMRTSSNSDNNDDHNNISISFLTLDALKHYKVYYNKNFQQSLIEEKIYEPGIFSTSDRVTKMLANILHVGKDPDKTTNIYQPTVFNTIRKKPFFMEIFSRTMWLLSKTRREMKASTLKDYEKVINVLEKQVMLVLEEKPMDFKSITGKMIEMSFAKVLQSWQQKHEEDLQSLIKNSSSIQALKKTFIERNHNVIVEQRIALLKKGTKFPKVNENSKKSSGMFVAKLSNNEKDLIISDAAVKSNVSETHQIINIKHLVEGPACRHVKMNAGKNSKLAFSVIFNNESFLNFIAENEKEASYWKDGLNFLIKKENRSSYYNEELITLVNMDIALHLMEFQDIPLKLIKKTPPPIPPPPVDIKPPIPPRPMFLNR